MDSSNFLSATAKQFQYYKSLGEKTFDQLNDEDLFHAPSPESNSIAVIVNHLSGNMKSRWTDFLNTDGEKEWRNRDREFEAVIRTREDMNRTWEEGWAVLFDALDSVNESNFDQLVYIRNQGHTIVEAFLRQLCHYSYHIGQIVFMGRMIKRDAWTSLSIPKNASTTYNKELFDKEKGRGHFTDNP